MIPLLGKYLLFIMILVALSILNAILILAIYYREENRTREMPSWMRYYIVEILPPFLLMSSPKGGGRKAQQRVPIVDFFKLPKDDSLDTIFSRMLENLLHLGEIDRIFSKFDTAGLKNKVRCGARDALPHRSSVIV